MTEISREKVLEALGNITLPGTNDSLPDSGIVSSIVLRGGTVGFALEIGQSPLSHKEAEGLRQQCEEAIRALPGVEKATVVLTADNPKGSVRVEAKSSPKGGTTPPTPQPLTNIKHIIAVGSGKGGVGKSTVSANLAVALAQAGHKVGLVDADIHGPSVAKIMGISGEPEIQNNRMIPKESHGVKCMSMGLLLKENVPVVWRGPMVTKALQQLMRGADWGSLDFLIIDMPPGTGDIHLSVAQNFTLSGMVMVGTPQEVALMDVKKAISMFQKVKVPILGIIENMSYFQDPESDNKSYIFGKGNTEKLAKELGIPVLAEIPLEQAISTSSDAGEPFVATHGDSEAARLYSDVAKKIAEQFADKAENA